MSLENNQHNVETIDIVFQDCEENKISALNKKQNDKKQGYRELVLDLLQKSPEIGHLLVQLHDRNKLYAVAHSPDDTARAELTQIIVDLLSYDLSITESELISDVLMGLFRQAERELRRALSEKLAVMTGVPLRLVLKIASDEIYVADSILRKSQDLKDFDLIYILKSKGSEHWRSIAQRPNMSDNLIGMLVDKEDIKTSINLVQNKSIKLSGCSVNKIFEQAKTSDELAKPFLKRNEISPDLILRLYKYVGVELKEYIKVNFDGLEDDVSDAIDDSIIDIVSVGERYEPTEKHIKHAEIMMQKRLLTPQAMVDSLRSNDVLSFVAQFSVYCSLPIAVVDEMLHQNSGQLFAISCKALSVLKSDFINMFLLTSRVRGERIVSERLLSRAISYYEKIDESVARDLLTRYRH